MKDYIYILIGPGIQILACHSKTITNTPHNKNKILIADISELEWLIVRLTGRHVLWWEQLSAVLRMTPSLTPPVLRL